ncbi:MAG: hypothetical protein K2K75_00720 [Muribaculaceae bacterium]|nr:hypothetical protein [Muribaculaceae bacterium]
MEFTGYAAHKKDNLFYRYLNNSGDTEVYDFLNTAKAIEKQWHEMKSPWYYPQKKGERDETDIFDYEIERCKNYEGNRLKDRYALQVVRALFASHRFEDCIEYYDSVFPSFPDSNLMKRMAKRYVGGCWSRLDEVERANKMFAEGGDIWSLDVYDPVEYMVEHNPNAPQIIEYIRVCETDTALLTKRVPLARRMLGAKGVTNKGDWAFLLAYYYKEYANDYQRADEYIRKSLKQKFSTQELKDLAHVYKMKIDAYIDNRSTFLNDLKWLDKKHDIFCGDMNEWVRRTRNMIYVDWIPQLWKRKDYTTAILLATYADNLNRSKEWQEAWENVGWHVCYKPTLVYPVQSIRESQRYANHYDYACLSFQMMGSLSSSELIKVHKQMFEDNSLNKFLRKDIRNDKDYYYELIGTLALREENYAKAINFFSKVSLEYQKTMNIYKDGDYLRRDPFNPYPTRWQETGYYDNWEYERRVSQKTHESKYNAKLNFAKKMLDYQKRAKTGKTADERTWAQMMYAIGRRNSFEECWALTQYWRGGCTGRFSPDLDYWEDTFADNYYNFLFDYEKSIGHKRTEQEYQLKVQKSLASFETDEMRAKAEYLFNNLVTVVRKYPNTATGQHIMHSCDNWRDWI